MNIILSAIGSHGDVHPMVGIALRLRDRGHRVSIITNPSFESLVLGAGIEFLPFGTVEEFETLAADPNLWHPIKGIQTIVRGLVASALRQTYAIIRDHYQPGETILVSAALDFGARIAQEKLGIPTASIQLAPGVFRSVHQSPVLPPALMGDKVPVWLKRLQFWIADHWFVDPNLKPEVNAFRAELGLAPVTCLFDRWWHSPDRVIAMFPEWFAAPQPDWPPQVRLASFPLWDEMGFTEVSTEAAQFLSQGDPPIAFTPGSAMLHGHKFFQAAAEACERLGCRGVLLTRHPEQIPCELPDGVRHFDYIPFGYALSRCAAVVHHGGIGSVAQGLATGTPQLIMPMTFDQPDNAARLKRLGVAESIRPKNFRAPAVAGALSRLVRSPDVAKKCREIAARLENVDGIALACEEIEKLID